jgi:hypothetical protein
MRPSPQLSMSVASTINYLDRMLRARGVWHCLAYGTLLGAVRQGAVIAWDYDFDMFVRPSDVPRLLTLNGDLAADGYRLEEVPLDGSRLAINPLGIERAVSGHLALMRGGDRCGDLFVFNLFSDGVLRRFDVERGVYWVPHNAFPHYFVERLEAASIDGVPYPVPQHADVLLAGLYGEHWREPYRAVIQGGTGRDGLTIHSHRYDPKLRAEIAWCEAQGWNRTKYRNELRWPRPIHAAGPIGPTARTEDTSRALWWRSAAELIEHF